MDNLRRKGVRHDFLLPSTSWGNSTAKEGRPGCDYLPPLGTGSRTPVEYHTEEISREPDWKNQEELAVPPFFYANFNSFLSSFVIDHLVHI
ncbi:hypothetical protein PMAYCL1PPCAC_29758, partial [Pristionchus mayeri]